MNMLKKNQIIIYTFALMLVAAGYLNYTGKIKEEAMETAVEELPVENIEMADIGDATLVNSNDVVTDNNVNNTMNSTSQNKIDKNNTIKSENTDSSTNNTNTSSQSIETSSNITNDEYFVKSKLERDTMYSQMIESYEKILNSNNSLETRETISYTRNYKDK